MIMKYYAQPTTSLYLIADKVEGIIPPTSDDDEHEIATLSMCIVSRLRGFHLSADI